MIRWATNTNTGCVEVRFDSPLDGRIFSSAITRCSPGGAETILLGEQEVTVIVDPGVAREGKAPPHSPII